MDLTTLLSTALKTRISGIGGQGAILLGDVLAHAGALDGINSACSTLYGSQARGGASKCDVILAKQNIDFPHVERPNVLIALSQEAHDGFAKDMDEPRLVLYDDYFVKNLAGPESGLTYRAVDATTRVLDVIGSGQSANFYMLGVLVGLSQCVTLASLEESMAKYVRKRHLDTNLKAFHLGMEAARDEQGN